MSLLAAPRAALEDSAGELHPVRSRVGVVGDLVLVSTVALFAAWTLFYLTALAGVLPSGVAFWSWVVLSPLVVAASVRRTRPLLDAVPAASPWIALVLAGGAAAGSLLIVRPDLDDASYVVRSTWISANGDVRVGDVIFSDGAWPGLPAQTPYLPSVEALLGWVSRASGLSAGTVVYVLFPPLAAACAVWALWFMLRAWEVRRPTVALVVAGVFLVMSCAAPASWGNLHLGRIWQGKVTFLAVVVPLLYGLAAAAWNARSPGGRRAALAALGLAGVAGVGLTPAAVFVVPGVALAAAAPGLQRRSWSAAAALVAVGAGPALAAGTVMLFAGQTHGIGRVAAAAEDPWRKVVGAGVPALVVLLALAVAVLAFIRPGRFGGAGPVGRWTALAAVAIGVLVAVPAAYDVAVGVMGTDAIAWRLTWIVPVPALVGLLGALPSRSPRAAGGVLMAAAVTVALVWGGTPLWSPANGAWVTTSVAWKMPPPHLEAARWVAGQKPVGRVLAPVDTTAALGAVTADVRPVGSRGMYLEAYEGQPGALLADRGLLQSMVDGGAQVMDLSGAPAALAALHVDIVCAAGSSPALSALLDDAGYAPRFHNGVITCSERSVP